jgi:multidrug resistance efflux pump
MKQEVNPLFVIGAIVLAVLVLGFFVWSTGRPTPVTTDIPPKPNPPGGMVRIQ